MLAETDTLGNVLNEYVYFGGKRIALLPVGGNAQFYVEDMLGSSRVITTNTGVVCYDADFYPYGGERPITTSCTQNNYKFEGKERDVETSVGSGNTNGNNDDFGARYYSNRFGRWLSADWSNVAAAVPYANLSNPQTLNLYAMVSDDPESFADLDGHQPSCGGPNGPGGAIGGGPDCPEIDRARTADTNNYNAAGNQSNKQPAQKQNAPHPYVAPIGPGTEIGNFLDPAHPSNPGPIGKGECVEACRHYEKGLPDHTQWTQGVPVVITVDGKLTINPAVKPGTAIAAGWDGKGHYPGPENSHKNSGVFLGPALIGSAGSIRILDQWPGSPGPRPRDMNPTGGYGTWDVSNHSTAYYVIMAP